MTIPEIWDKLNRISPNKPVYGLACSMASLDTQTVLDLCEKYRTDFRMSQKQLAEEIRKQKHRRLFNEFKTMVDFNPDVHSVNR